MRKALALLALLAVPNMTARADDTVTPDLTRVSARDPRFAIMGRIAFGAADEARMGFPGVTIRFTYRGPAPTLRLTALSPGCFFNLSCNGWEPVLMHLKQGENAIPLPSGTAPPTGWVVELVRRNESWQGVAAFEGLTLPAGCELLPPPPLPERRLLFIGDSVTCGEYIDCMPPGDSESQTSRSANASRAFGMLLGRTLGAQVHLVSYGGRGVMRTWDGQTDSNNAPQFFPLALPDDSSSPWDHSQYAADAIVVCLGQNDFSSGMIDETEYATAYAQFITQVRAAHPRAGLVLASSPMHGEDPASEDGARRARLLRCLEIAATQVRASSDVKVAVVSLHHQPGTTLNAHPSAFQHEQIAQDILPALRSVTGW